MLGMFRKCLVLLLIFELLFGSVENVQAARGIPGSPEFGIGAILYPDGPNIQQALAMASDLELDWIVIPVDWAAYQSNQGQIPQFQKLDIAMQFAAQQNIAVMVSLSKAPAWAQSPSGPNSAAVAQFISTLAQRYPDALRAVELFPGANTLTGWGAAPNAQAYASLLQAVGSQVHLVDPQVLLVAAGLRPLVASAEKGDINDLQFLQDLYAQGASSFMPVISMQYADLAGLPVAFPINQDERVLRHYEAVRQVMTANNHQSGLIWITRLSPPSGKIDASDSVFQDKNMQSNWMSLAYIQLRAQLYIGVTIGQSLNSNEGGTDVAVPSLISGSGEYHPFYSVLHEMISLNSIGSVSIKPGKPKEGNLPKKRP